MYKMMCFNVLTHNLDDHAKNFSFIYDENKKKYILSPFYDITYSNTYYGEHTISINGKGSNITSSDLIIVGTSSGLSKKWCEDTYKNIFLQTNRLKEIFSTLF